MIPIRTSVLRELLDAANRRYLGLPPAAPITSRRHAPPAQAGSRGLAARSRPHIDDAGVWRGITEPDWVARFQGRTDDHAGAKPIYVGPRRRRTDRIVAPIEPAAA